MHQQRHLAARGQHGVFLSIAYFEGPTGSVKKVLHTPRQTNRVELIQNSTPYKCVYPFRRYCDNIAVKKTFLGHFLLKSRNIDIEEDIQKPNF